ncbi:MAG: DEAD/DEAH box helicase [Gammaproteobacteria bacterium]|nr:DEAD/DEAH box helicase [Gammaproteobacteria bacterium]
MNSFEQLGLKPEILRALRELNYENTTPVQNESIPLLLQGKNLLAQAQTGTGKTAAFGLPLIHNISIEKPHTQALILAPTRELALQVMQALESFSKYLPGFKSVAIYGGQDFRPQLKALKEGAHVVVGTPGRVMDHIRRGTLKLDHIRAVVLDEADEMLNMGFLEDVEWILEQIPVAHQVALFSATMPDSIRKIASRYLKDAEHVRIQPTLANQNAIKQVYVEVSGRHKMEALKRFLEAETYDGAIVFTKTKVASTELAEHLENAGLSIAAINGDMPQELREQVIKRLKNGSLNIIVATDVAARGLDVDRISLVINYDIPFDTESYVHRIGRTGRAGREGKALLFVSPNERGMLRKIERFTQKPIEPVEPPALTELRQIRTQRFINKVSTSSQNLAALENAKAVIQQIEASSNLSLLDIAAAMATMADASLFTSIKDADHLMKDRHSFKRERERDFRPQQGKFSRDREPRFAREDRFSKEDRFEREDRFKSAEPNMTQCRIEVGSMDGLTPGDVLKLILNQNRNLSRRVVGHIRIEKKHCLIDLSKDVAHEIVHQLHHREFKNRPVKMSLSKRPH